MTDNRTTELLRDYAFALRRLEYAADKPGSNMTLGEYEAEEKKITDEYSQAIAATLGGGECENLIDPWSVHDSSEPDFECSVCHASGHANGNIDGGEYLFCPRCGEAVKR